MKCEFVVEIAFEMPEIFSDSPELGTNECICSFCGAIISELIPFKEKGITSVKKSGIRLLMPYYKDGKQEHGEFRFHKVCLDYVWSKDFGRIIGEAREDGTCNPFIFYNIPINQIFVKSSKFFVK